MQFYLRKWRESDVADVAFFANNKKIADNLRDVFPHPYTEKDAREYIGGCLTGSEERSLLRAIEIEGRAAGSIGVFLKDDVYRLSAELGYWLAEPYWGKGVMTEAIREITELAFSRFDLRRVYAEPFAYNTGSRRALEKAGFTLEGVMKSSVVKNGRVFDSCLYARVLDFNQIV